MTSEARKQYKRDWVKQNRKDNPDYYRDKQARTIKERKQWYKDYKANQSCERCGFSHPAALQFHHRDPKTKKHQVCRMVSSGHSVKAILAEIAKCEVLCANCHHIEHYGETFD